MVEIWLKYGLCKKRSRAFSWQQGQHEQVMWSAKTKTKTENLKTNQPTNNNNKKTPKNPLIFLGQINRNSLSRPGNNSPLYWELLNSHLEDCDQIMVPQFKGRVLITWSWPEKGNQNVGRSGNSHMKNSCKILVCFAWKKRWCASVFAERDNIIMSIKNLAQGSLHSKHPINANCNYNSNRRGLECSMSPQRATLGTMCGNYAKQLFFSQNYTKI